MSKVGIFSGTFDPVHAGHIAFALQALQSAELDEVFFMPDVVPHHKSGVTHYAHRIAMVKLALKPYQKLKVLEMTDKQFTVARTLPKLQHTFQGSELHLLVGTDVLEQLHLKAWPNQETLLESMRLVVGVRSKGYAPRAQMLLDNLQHKGTLVETERSAASSREIRTALHAGEDHQDVLDSLREYIAKNWLYASVTS